MNRRYRTLVGVRKSPQRLAAEWLEALLCLAALAFGTWAAFH